MRCVCNLDVVWPVVQEPMLMQTELNHLTAELQRLTAHKQKLLADLPTLCSLSASLQDTHVLHEDYNAKLLRQQHCIAKQKTIVRLLIEQHARQQLLCLARDAEVERLQSLMQELQLLLEVLKGAKDASQQRIASYIGQELESDAEPKLVVHNSDSFLQTLHGVLSSRPADSSGPPNSSNSSKAHLYVTVAQLKSQLGQLASSSEVSSSHQHAEDMHKQIAASLQASFGSLHTLLFPESSIAAVQLTAPELHEALQKAQSASTDLTKAVQQVTQKQQMYQNLLSQQRVQLEAEQQVFSRFHTNPETLHELCSGM